MVFATPLNASGIGKFFPMNLLAHLYLSPPGPEAMAGNLIADCIKGSALAALPPLVQAGVRFHRRVDSATDAHPVFRRSRARFGPAWGRFSGILVDVTYDHCLTVDWECYSEQPLASFLAQRHALLAEIAGTLPAPGGPWLSKVAGDGRMGSYGTIGGIGYALGRISASFRTMNPELARACDLIADQSDGFREDFAEFLPDLKCIVAMDL